MTKYSHTANILRAHSQSFEVADCLVKLFPASVLHDLGNSQWQNILQEVLYSINTMRQTAYKRIMKSIIPWIPTSKKHLIRLHGAKQFSLVGHMPLSTLFQGEQCTLERQIMFLITAMLRSISELERSVLLKRLYWELLKKIYHLHIFLMMMSRVFLALLPRYVLSCFFLIFKSKLLIGLVKTREE